MHTPSALRAVRRRGPPALLALLLATAAPSAAEIHVADFLPPGHVTDGSVDYTPYVQAALDAAAGGTLVLPDHPVLVSRNGWNNWCLLAPPTIAVVGSPSSVLREERGAVQILRVEDAQGVRLEGFGLEGLDADGYGLAHGLLQVTRGRDVVVREVSVRNSDADGIAIANASNVLVTGCRLENVSKASIYLSDCELGRVTANVVTDFGGHTWGAGWTVGTGIQLSSSSDVVCADNLVARGLGVGIACGALSGGAKPEGVVLRGNRIVEVSNPTNVNYSGGIRLNNGNPDKLTNTLVTGNSVRACGAHGIYVDGHDGTTIQGNAIAESERAGLFVSSVRDLLVLDNTILNSDTAGVGQQAGILLFNQATRVVARGNVIRNASGYAPGKAAPAILDFSKGGGHDLEPDIRYAAAPPAVGVWRAGDVVYDSRPEQGESIGWVCLAAGSPGLWLPFGWIGQVLGGTVQSVPTR